ncbi:MAG: choice-of-anchor D domain-containing protein [Bacteroidia bacterium]
MKRNLLSTVCGIVLALSPKLNAQITATAVVTGPNTTVSPYMLPAASNVTVTSILTSSDAVGGYTMCGLGDGMGAFDNGDGTFTLLMNHEMTSGAGATHAHGSTGAFVSKWVINKSNFTVVSGADLIQNVHIWNGASYDTYNSSNPNSLAAFNRFCSADLPKVSAFYNGTSGLGTTARIFMNGEESGTEGRMFAHIASGANAGNTYHLPHLGRFSCESQVASPYKSNKTIVVGMDDATPGQVYVYIGTKTNTGTDIDKAGLTNGNLYGVAVASMVTEVNANVPAPNTTFSLINLGDVSGLTGAALNTNSNNNGVTNFLRPEDGAWDPMNPNDFYFVTTNSFSSPSRLWKLHFTDINNPENGGTITAVLDGTEGQKMLDNVGFDHYGHLLLQEDPGGNVHTAKLWQYNVATDVLTLILDQDPARFVNAGPNFLTNDEESSGVIDMQGILNTGWFLIYDQVHSSLASPMVERGQLLAFYNPATGNANSLLSGPSTTATPYMIPAAPGVSVSAILTAGEAVGGYTLAGLGDGMGAFDNGDGTFTALLNHEMSSSQGDVRAHGQAGSYVSKWVINKTTMAVVSGADLIQNVNIWNGTGYTTYNASNPSALTAFGRFCSADLPKQTAFYNSYTGNGTMEKIFMNGEESGSEGRAFGHIASGANAGTTYELPRLGKASWENQVPCPYKSDKTIVVGLDDANGGQVYFYVGTKTNTGSEVQKAGLTNGNLYGVAVASMVTESSASIPSPNTTFSLISLGNVEAITGSSLQTMSNNLGVTGFLRPEDGVWDPMNPRDFYFVTTNSFSSPSRLWRLRFHNINNPENGGTITAVLDGTEGQKMLDNMTIDNSGHIILQEDPGGQNHTAVIWQYDIATDNLTKIVDQDPDKFIVGGGEFLTIDEESSGAIDMQGILNTGWYLEYDQAHYTLPNPMVQGGQLLAFYVPATANNSPEINVWGNSNNIPNNAVATSSTNNTDFGSVQISTSANKTFSISNTGVGNIVVNSLGFIGGNMSDFSFLNPPSVPFTIAPGGSATFAVMFTPSATGTRSTSVVFMSNDNDEDYYQYKIEGNAFTTVGLNEVGANSLPMSVYPNPSDDQFTIELNTVQNETIKVEVFNLLGQNVMTVSKEASSGKNNIQLNTSGLANGGYFVKVSAGKKSTTTKLMVQH